MRQGGVVTQPIPLGGVGFEAEDRHRLADRLDQRVHATPGPHVHKSDRPAAEEPENGRWGHGNTSCVSAGRANCAPHTSRPKPFVRSKIVVEFREMTDSPMASFRTDPTRALQLYRDRGYHVEADIVPEDVISRVMAAAMEQPNAGNGQFPPIPMPHRVHPAFFELMRFRPIVAIVERLVGGRASGLGGEFFYMKPGTPGFARHQDNAYVQAPPDNFVSGLDGAHRRRSGQRCTELLSGHTYARRFGHA